MVVGIIYRKISVSRIFLAFIIVLNVIPGLLCAQKNTPFHIQGVPRIIHFTKKEFNSDAQFWAMCQDKKGILYFGNNEGVLVFDGGHWQKVVLPNRSSVRSLRLSQDGQIYAGGFNELGIVKCDSYGKYYYESKVELLRQEDRNIENVWQIHEAEGYVIFRTAKKLIALKSSKAITLPTTGNYWYSAVIDDQYYVLDNEGFKKLNLTSLVFEDLVGNAAFQNQEVLALLPGFNNAGLILLTKKGRIYNINEKEKSATFVRQLIPENSNNLSICATRSTAGQYYIGTLSEKIIVLDASGNNITLSDAFQNLQDNTVLNLFESNDGNIWALLNNGIDCIDVSSPMSMLVDNASVFDVLFVNNTMHVATNQGVLVSDYYPGKYFSPYAFSKVPGLEGQAWSLQYFNSRILCSHDRGLFELSKNGVRRIPGITGVWKVIPVKGREGYFLGCTYETIYLIRYEEPGGFVVVNKIEGFNESSRDILQSDEPGVFWVCHGYKGVFRIKINEDFSRVVGLEHFKGDHGLPSPFNINVFRWRNDIVFTTNEGIYTFDEQSGHFNIHAELTRLFGVDHNVRKLLERGDRTWFVDDDEAGYFMTGDSAYVLEKGLFLSLKGTFNQGMECIIPVDDNQVLMGTISGLYAFNVSFRPSVKKTVPLFTSVQIQLPSGMEQALLNPSHAPKLEVDNKSSSIRFDFAVPDFQDRMNIQYSYRLDDVDRRWSAWQETSYKELSYLRPGKYVFRVKARSLLGEISEEVAYPFQVMPSWYQTWWAYTLYSILIVIAIVSGSKMLKRKIQFEKEKTKEEEAKKRKVLELEIQQVRLTREKEQIIKDKEQLEEDVIYKSKELANYTMLMVKKRELLTEMYDELKKLKDHLRNDASRLIVRDLTKKINANLEDEEHLKIFEANFERVHHEFFTHLKTSFVDLTQKELQLCAFVRMNLTNKEIASILNISVRGVETARYRLRKRLGMSHEQDMSAFLEKLYSSTTAPQEG